MVKKREEKSRVNKLLDELIAEERTSKGKLGELELLKQWNQRSSAGSTVSISELINLEQLARVMQQTDGISVQDRQFLFKQYPQCFVGRDAVDWLSSYLNISRKDSVEIGRCLVDKKWICHVLNEHTFKDKYLFYRFCNNQAKSDK
ncbi:MAG: hypothetical protein F6J87_24385 [Spirulina sp. SIO3F2]|nr:hypothetical protein [Spirulina sp. SIO3F2]